MPDLTKYGSHVYVLVRRGELRASKIMAKRLVSNPKITILWNTVAVECQGDGDLLNNLRIRNVVTGEDRIDDTYWLDTLAARRMCDLFSPAGAIESGRQPSDSK